MKAIIISVFTVLACGLFSFAQTPTPSKSPDAAVAEGSEVKIDAPVFFRDPKRNLFIGKGSGKKQVRIEEVGHNYKLLTDLFEYSEENETADIKGNLTFTNPDTTVNASDAFANFGDSKIVFKGKVKIVSHRKESADGKAETKAATAKSVPDSKSGASKTGSTTSDATPASTAQSGTGNADGSSGTGKTDGTADAKSKPSGPAKAKKTGSTTLTCDDFDFDYDARVGLATGNLKIVQDEKTATAEKATFEEEKNIITLEGKVEMREGKKTLSCERIIINVNDDSWNSEGSKAVFTHKPKKKKNTADDSKANEKEKAGASNKSTEDSKAKTEESPKAG